MDRLSTLTDAMLPFQAHFPIRLRRPHPRADIRHWWTGRVWRQALALSLLAVGTALASDFWSFPIPAQGEAPGDYVTLTKDLAPATCGLCHPKQYREWSGSRHALAAGPGLLGQLPAFDRETQLDCLRCHAPSSEQQDIALEAEPGALASLSGVDCAACHVRQHRRYGPRSVPITPHGSVEGLALFKEAQFCAPCHQFPAWGERLNGKLLENTEQEWLASPFAREGVDCQDCHMPQGSHAFAGIHDPAMTRKGLSLRAERTAKGLQVWVKNLGAGHALPTYATPRIRLSLRSLSSGATLEHRIQRQLAWDPDAGWRELADTRLEPGEERRFGLELSANEKAEVTVTVEPDALYHELVFPSLEQSVGEDLEPESLRLLQRAKRQAKDSPYLLYRADCPSWGGSLVPCAARELDLTESIPAARPSAAAGRQAAAQHKTGDTGR